MSDPGVVKQCPDGSQYIAWGDPLEVDAIIAFPFPGQEHLFFVASKSSSRYDLHFHSEFREVLFPDADDYSLEALRHQTPMIVPDGERIVLDKSDEEVFFPVVRHEWFGGLQHVEVDQMLIDDYRIAVLKGTVVSESGTTELYRLHHGYVLGEAFLLYTDMNTRYDASMLYEQYAIMLDLEQSLAQVFARPEYNLAKYALASDLVREWQRCTNRMCKPLSALPY